MVSEPAFMAALRKACDGLLFISESEAEVTPVCWQRSGDLDPTRILDNPDRPHEAGTPVETTTLESFFRAVSPEDRPRFDELTRVLTANLQDLRVYKIGEIEKDVYVVGKAPGELWAGVRTSVVET